MAFEIDWTGITVADAALILPALLNERVDVVAPMLAKRIKAWDIEGKDFSDPETYAGLTMFGEWPQVKNAILESFRDTRDATPAEAKGFDIEKITVREYTRLQNFNLLMPSVELIADVMAIYKMAYPKNTMTLDEHWQLDYFGAFLPVLKGFIAALRERTKNLKN